MMRSVRRWVAVALLPVMVVSLMGAKGACSPKNGASASSAAPDSAPTPVPEPSVSIPAGAKEIPAPMADKAAPGMNLPAPPPPPFQCSSWLDPFPIGARVVGHVIHVAVNAWCYDPPKTFHLVIVLFKYNDHGIPVPVVNGSATATESPLLFPSWSNYGYDAPCAPGKYSVTQTAWGTGSDLKTPYEAGPAHGDYLYVGAGQC